MSSFGPSEQQIAADEAASNGANSRVGEMLSEMSREELVASLESELLKNDKLAAEIKELREEKVKLNLILEEEDERRSNMFLKRMEELERLEKDAARFCPACAASTTELRSRSNSISSLRMDCVPEISEETE